MQVSLHIDKDTYVSKPTKKEIQKINRNIVVNKSTLTPTELAEKLAKGHTVLTSLMLGSRRLENFESCQVLMLDFDNTVHVNQQKQKINDNEYLTFEEICLHPFILDHASFVYKTFNYSEELHKFRVVFILSEKITTIQDLALAYQTLFKLFPTADTACKDASRLFFGGLSYTEINFNNVLQTGSLLQNKSLSEATIEEAGEVLQESTSMEITEDLKQQLDMTSNETVITNYYQTKNKELLTRYFEEMHLRIDTSVADTKLFYTRLDMVMYINSINTYKLLGIPDVSKVFHCVLTKDIHPSASIFKVPDKDYYLYKRFGEQGFVLNNMKILALLLNIEENKVVDFMKEPLNMTMTYPEYIIEIQQKKDALLTHLKKEDLKINYPNTYKILHKHISLIEDILNVLSVSTYKDKRKIRLLSAKSTRSWTECLCGKDRVESQKKKITNLLNTMNYLGLIIKLDIKEYPEKYKKDTVSYKINNKFSKYSSIFELNYSTNITNNFLIESIENKCALLVENNLTVNKLTQDFLTLIDSVNESNKVFKQTQNKKITKQNKEMLSDIEKYLIKEFSTKEFIFVNDIKQYLLNLAYSKKSIKMKFNINLNICLAKLNKKKKRLSKSLIVKYNISENDSKGFPSIIENLI